MLLTVCHRSSQQFNASIPTSLSEQALMIIHLARRKVRITSPLEVDLLRSRPRVALHVRNNPPSSKTTHPRPTTPFFPLNLISSVLGNQHHIISHRLHLEIHPHSQHQPLHPFLPTVFHLISYQALSPPLQTTARPLSAYLF